MKKLLIILFALFSCTACFARDYKVYGPQGGLAMDVTLPAGFDAETDHCPMVILIEDQTDGGDRFGFSDQTT